MKLNLITDLNLSGRLSGVLNRKGVIIGIIIFVSLTVYSNTLYNGFVYDDVEVVLNNHWIKDVRNIPTIFSENVWKFKFESAVVNYYRPLLHMINMFNYHIFGFKPWGFHLISILFHAGVSVLIFIVTRRLLQVQFQGADVTVPSLMAALIFATHPIHTEAVAWLTAIMDLSYTLFFLLSLYFYMRTRDGHKKSYLCSVASFALAALSKEPALALPVFLFVYDYISMNKDENILKYLKNYIAYLIVSVLYILIRIYALKGFSPQKVSIKLSAYEYFINVFPLFTDYIEKLILPVKLNAYYVFHPIYSIFETTGLVSMAVTAVFLFLFYLSLRKRNAIFMAFMFIVVPLLPALYIPAMGFNVFTERYLYLPSFGFVFLIAFGLSWVQVNIPKIHWRLNLIILLVIGLYIFQTVDRNEVWKDDYSLFSDTVKKSPDSSHVHNNFGVACAKRGQIDEAIREYIEALRLKPRRANVHNNLGNAYFMKGRIDEAIKEYRAVVEIAPGFDEGYYNLGVVYYDSGKIDEAINEYQTAVKLNPNHLDAHFNLGLAYEIKGKTVDAISEFEKVIKINPLHRKALQKLELLLIKDRSISNIQRNY